MQGRIDCRLELKKGLGFHRQSLWGKYTPVAERRLDERGGVCGVVVVSVFNLIE